MARGGRSGKQPDSEDYGPPLIDSGARGQPFPSTILTEIRKVKDGDEAAITRFYGRYATPVLCYFLACGFDRETSKDLTQEVFLKLLTGEPLADFKVPGFRFRPYLKRVLANMRVDVIRRQGALRRQPPEGLVSLDKVLEEAGEFLEPVHDDTPEDAFDRRYTYELLNTVIECVCSECERDGLEFHLLMFVEKSLKNPPLTWVQIGAMYGVTADEARNRARTVQKRFGSALLKELKATGMSDADAADEARDLMRVFQRRGGAGGRRGRR